MDSVQLSSIFSCTPNSPCARTVPVPPCAPLWCTSGCSILLLPRASWCLFISIPPEDTGFYSHVLLFAFSAPLVPFCNAFSTCATFKPRYWLSVHQNGWFCSLQQHAPQHHICQALWWVSSREQFSIGLTSWIGLPSSLMWCKRGCGPAGPGVRQGKAGPPKSEW